MASCLTNDQQTVSVDRLSRMRRPYNLLEMLEYYAVVEKKRILSMLL